MMHISWKRYNISFQIDHKWINEKIKIRKQLLNTQTFQVE